MDGDAAGRTDVPVFIILTPTVERQTLHQPSLFLNLSIAHSSSRMAADISLVRWRISR